MTDHLAALEELKARLKAIERDVACGNLSAAQTFTKVRDAHAAAIALMRGQNGLLARIQTHLAVGCIPITGYKSAHNRLAIEIDSALSYQPKDTADEQ